MYTPTQAKIIEAQRKQIKKLSKEIASVKKNLDIKANHSDHESVKNLMKDEVFQQ